MPVNDLLVGLCGMTIILVIALGGWIFGSEYYLFVPDASLRWGLDGPTAPPTTFGFIIFLMAVPAALFLISRRSATVFFTALPLLAILGIPVGILLYEWTPGLAHYLLTVALCGMAVFLWSNDNFHDD